MGRFATGCSCILWNRGSISGRWAAPCISCPPRLLKRNRWTGSTGPSVRHLNGYRMLKEPLSITAVSTLSSLGESGEQLWQSYLDKRHFLSEISMGDQWVWASPLSASLKEQVGELRLDPRYRSLDDSVLFALYAGRKAIEAAHWGEGTTFGVNIGSSRGATSLFERFHREFL